jgi:hypothetical protein
MTTVKATLIQASNNISTGVPIFTFRFTSTTKFWLLEKLGIGRWFDRWLNGELVATGTDTKGLFKHVANVFSFGEIIQLEQQVREVRLLTERVFQATRGNGRITGVDIQKAVDLFGKNLQDVLKQYRTGECHRPPGVGAGHRAVACSDGWEFPLDYFN